MLRRPKNQLLTTQVDGLVMVNDVVRRLKKVLQDKYDDVRYLATRNSVEDLEYTSWFLCGDIHIDGVKCELKAYGLYSTEDEILLVTYYVQDGKFKPLNSEVYDFSK